MALSPDKCGFLGYALNIAGLAPQHEHLRASVVWNVYGWTMLFRTLDEAMTFRNAMIFCSKQCPPIVCVEDCSYLSGAGGVPLLCGRGSPL